MQKEIQEVENEIKEVEEHLFSLDMIDSWTRTTFQMWDELFEKKKHLQEVLKELKERRCQ